MSQPTVPPDQMRQLIAQHRQGEQARVRIAAALDPLAVYSELPDPPPVFVVDKSGQLHEVKPVSLYFGAAPAAPAGR